MKFADVQKRQIAMFEDPAFLERIREEDDEMLKYMKILQEINSHGFLTENSQAGKREYVKNKYDIHERSYLSGFMMEKDAADFIKNMGINTDKNAIFIPIVSDDTQIPSVLDIPLTIQKKGKGFEVATHMPVVLPKSQSDFFKKQKKLNVSEKVVYIFCWDPIWNRKGDLFKDVLAVLKKL